MCNALKCDKCNAISGVLYLVSKNWCVCKKCKEEIEEECDKHEV